MSINRKLNWNLHLRHDDMPEVQVEKGEPTSESTEHKRFDRQRDVHSKKWCIDYKGKNHSLHVCADSFMHQISQ
jgi:hypothetical protein